MLPDLPNGDLNIVLVLVTYLYEHPERYNVGDYYI